MSEVLSHRIQEFARAARMLAIVGAAVKLRSSSSADDANHQHIQAGLRLALGDAAADLDDADTTPLLTAIEMALTEASDLFKHPDQTAGWKVADPHHLQAMGRASSQVADRIVGLAATRPALAAALRGVFLDVGTGVGGIALRAAATCPDLQVDAIDIWDSALRLAGENVAASPHAARIHVRHLDVTELPAGPRYTLAWLPTMYLKRDVLERAMDRIVAASHPGGWLVAALYTRPDDPFMAVMASLRTLRGGGEVTEPAELVNLLRSRGYAEIDVDVTPVATFVLGRLP